MKAIFPLILIGSLAGAANADTLDELLESNCGFFLNPNKKLLSEDAKSAYMALSHSWIIVTDAFGIVPPIAEVCAENPELTAAQAMKEAIGRVKK